MLTRHGACKAQRVFAQDALVRIGAQEGFHQYRKARTLRFLPHCHLQRFVNFWQQDAAFTVGQEAVVAHHFKVSGREMADVTPQHLLLRQLLAFVLLGFVVVILVNDCATTVMPQLGRRHRRPFQVPAQIFHAAPGPAGLFGEVHLPVPLVLRLQVALPLFFIADVAMTRQGSRVNALIAGAQQTDDGTAPDGFNLLFFEKQIAPDGVFDIETATGNGDVDVLLDQSLRFDCKPAASISLRWFSVFCSRVETRQ